MNGYSTALVCRVTQEKYFSLSRAVSCCELTFCPLNSHFFPLSWQALHFLRFTWTVRDKSNACTLTIAITHLRWAKWNLLVYRLFRMVGKILLKNWISGYFSHCHSVASQTSYWLPISIFDEAPLRVDFVHASPKHLRWGSEPTQGNSFWKCSFISFKKGLLV